MNKSEVIKIRILEIKILDFQLTSEDINLYDNIKNIAI